MSSRKSRRKVVRPISWLVTMFVSLLLLGLGFFGGVVGGIATDEPDLAWSYVKSVILGQTSGGDLQALPEVLGSRQGYKNDERTGAVDKGDHLGEISIQVGAFSNLKQATEMVEMLHGEGYEAYATSDGSTHRVRVGPVRSRDRVEDLIHRLDARGLPIWIPEK